MNKIAQLCLLFYYDVILRKVVRNIITLVLAITFGFATIGVGIISTFCDGCDDEHINISYWIDTDNMDTCSCCESNEMSCCLQNKVDQHNQKTHQSQYKYAKLKIDIDEKKTNITVDLLPFILISVLTNHLFSNNILQQRFLLTNFNIPPPKTGRTLLTLICILRN